MQENKSTIIFFAVLIFLAGLCFGTLVERKERTEPLQNLALECLEKHEPKKYEAVMADIERSEDARKEDAYANRMR